MSTPDPPPLRLWPLLRHEARAHPGGISYVLAAGGLALIPALSVPLLMRAFVDRYLVGDEPGWARIAVIGLFGAALLTGVLTLLQHWVAARLSTQLSATEPTRFVWHALRVPVPEVDEMGAGGVAARGASLQRLAYQSGYLVPMSLTHIVEFVVFAAALLVLDLRLGAAALGVVAVSSLVSWATLRARASHQVRADGLRVAQSALTTTLVADIESVKAAAAENWVFDRWCQVRTKLGQSVSHLGVVGLRLDAIPFLTQTLGLGVVLGLGAWLVMAGSLSLGTLLAAQGLLLGVLLPASMLMYLGVVLQGVASSASQAAQVSRIGLDPEVATVADPVPVPTAGPVGLALQGVTFGYAADQPPLFADLDLQIAAGTAVALVGGSGSGKSTIVRLAIGELQPWAGTVALAGHPRARLRRQDRARLLAYVPQSPVLVPGTIRENLTLFDPDVPLSAVVRAARDAAIEDAIHARPLGYEEPLGASGHGFSGGEVQRLAIARALVTDPRIVVLDEATSALDPIVEAQVMANLRRRGCTLLMVAHRISAVRDADELLVLDGGRLVQHGSFAQLRGVGRFAELTNG